MRPIDHYDTLRRGREELLRQAESERMIRAASFKESRQLRLLRTIANWLRVRLLSRDYHLEQSETAEKNTFSISNPYKITSHVGEHHL
nr:hypothetical protein [Ktedonobacteraceae bacterium]